MMDSNIDPQINGSSAEQLYDVTGSQDSKKIISDHNSISEKHGAEETHAHDADAEAVDTATRALKVLLYIPPEERDVIKDVSAEKDDVHYPGFNGDTHTQASVTEEEAISQLVDRVTRTSPNSHGSNGTNAVNNNASVISNPTPTSNVPPKNGSSSSSSSGNFINRGLKIVMMDPSTKEGLSRRLGRPRKTLRTTETPQQSSESNSADSKISRFRVETAATRLRGGSKHSNGLSGNGDSMRYASSSARLKLGGKHGLSFQHLGSARSKRRVIQHADGFKMVIEDPRPASDPGSFNFVGAGNILLSQPQLLPSTSSSPLLPQGNSTRSTKKKPIANKNPIVIENIASLKAKGRSALKEDQTKFRINKTTVEPIVAKAKNGK